MVGSSLPTNQQQISGYFRAMHKRETDSTDRLVITGHDPRIGKDVSDEVSHNSADTSLSSTLTVSSTKQPGYLDLPNSSATSRCYGLHVSVCLSCLPVLLRSTDPILSSFYRLITPTHMSNVVSSLPASCNAILAFKSH